MSSYIPLQVVTKNQVLCMHSESNTPWWIFLVLIIFCLFVCLLGHFSFCFGRFFLFRLLAYKFVLFGVWFGGIEVLFR